MESAGAIQYALVLTMHRDVRVHNGCPRRRSVPRKCWEDLARLKSTVVFSRANSFVGGNGVEKQLMSRCSSRSTTCVSTHRYLPPATHHIPLTRMNAWGGRGRQIPEARHDQQVRRPKTVRSLAAKYAQGQDRSRVMKVRQSINDANRQVCTPSMGIIE